MKRNHLIYGLTVVLLVASGCGGRTGLPEPGTELYEEVTSAFYIGITALQAGESLGAEDQLVRVTELVPEEPAAWINLGILSMRQNEFDLAAERLERAKRLAPENAKVELVLGRLATARGNFDEAIVHYRRALELEPDNVRAAYALVEELQRQGGPESAEEVQQRLEQLAASRPQNLAVQLELARSAARRGDTETVRQVVERLTAERETFPEEIQEQLGVLDQAVESGPAPQIETQVAFLRNMLVRLPRFRQDLAEVQVPSEQMAELVETFMVLESPPAHPAPHDSTLQFTAAPLPFDQGGWNWTRAFTLDVESDPTITLANGTAVQPAEGTTLRFPGSSSQPPAPNSIITVDFNYDFRMELAMAGPGGFRFYVQHESGAFTDVTGELGLPASILNAPYFGVWAADLDLEGDMDLLLATPNGPAVVLQNNSDGTFSQRDWLDTPSVRGFAWADFDADGDPDPALLDAAGNLHLFTNLRGGLFRENREPIGQVAAIQVADFNGDAILDLLVLGTDGSLSRHFFDTVERTWRDEALGVWQDAPAPLEPGLTLLFAADLDNNGAIDLITSHRGGTGIWLGDVQNRAVPLTTIDSVFVQSVTDVTGDGKLDLVGVTAEGRPVSMLNGSTAGYQWRVIRTRAAETFGDQRINSFGIGGEIEIRSGLLFQKQVITDPHIHFGLGTNTEADAARIIWPNGSVQAEFDLASGQAVLAGQRLKGSCPWLFTFDGEQMQFVTDFIWRSPLGLAINGQQSAGVATTEDWVKISSDQLRPTADGFYDVRITADLWETHFFDHVSLLVVDHPDTVEVFVDERFVFPPPEMKVHVVGTLQPIVRAYDHAGADVTDVVSAVDKRYLGGFPLGKYQGVAPDHGVELVLPNDMPLDGVVLIGSGWIRPTDSSINVAVTQGRDRTPKPLRLEVPDGQGSWRTVMPNLGFPAGKTKTVVLPLDGVFTEENGERRLRLSTEMEIYWDAFFWAERRDEALVQTERLWADEALLRYRGFSAVSEANRTSPEVPDYSQLQATRPLWRDLEGYYTRFGPVEELLDMVDDRYVIMNAGDELVMRFRAPEGPRPGWKRDYVLIGDGWVKDGDLNTVASETVLPLPTHARSDYEGRGGRLEDDPVYQAHREDWVNYHTRYVSPEPFHFSLRPNR